MSVIWSGITESGAIVPVQVTDQGKVMADVVVERYWTPTDTGIESQSSIEVTGNGSFSGDVSCNGVSGDSFVAGTNPSIAPSSVGFYAGSDGRLNLGRAAGTNVLRFFQLGGSRRSGVFNSDGSCSLVDDKCGFTPDGELFFTSRNNRYKLVVQGNLVVPEPYPENFTEMAPYAE